MCDFFFCVFLFSQPSLFVLTQVLHHERSELGGRDSICTRDDVTFTAIWCADSSIYLKCHFFFFPFENSRSERQLQMCPIATSVFQRTPSRCLNLSAALLTMRFQRTDDVATELLRGLLFGLLLFFFSCHLSRATVVPGKTFHVLRVKRSGFLRFFAFHLQSRGLPAQCDETNERPLAGRRSGIFNTFFMLVLNAYRSLCVFFFRCHSNYLFFRNRRLDFICFLINKM